jgi:hypothetical protein
LTHISSDPKAMMGFAFVMAGLDPAIHVLRETINPKPSAEPVE